MKMNIRLMLAAVIAVSISLTSCKKSEDQNNQDLATHSDDQSRFSSANDELINDANNIIDDNPAFNGRPGSLSTLFLPCNVITVLDSTASLRRLTITYNGVNCQGNRLRNGVVTLTMPLATHWADAGAVLTIEATNLKVTRVSDNKSITINGRYTITNVTGGRIWELAGAGTIIHEIASNGMNVTFDNGTQRNWKIAQRRTFTYNNGIVISITGTHTQGSVTNIAEWGTTRFGSEFTAATTAPMVMRQDCDFRWVSGQITHDGAWGVLVSTFGLDATGNATGCPGAGVPYYFKAVWTGDNGATGTAIYPY